MKNLKDYRLKLGLSLRKAAKSIGISHGTLANIENGQIDVGYQKVAKVIEFYKKELGENYHE